MGRLSPATSSYLPIGRSLLGVDLDLGWGGRGEGAAICQMGLLKGTTMDHRLDVETQEDALQSDAITHELGDLRGKKSLNFSHLLFPHSQNWYQRTFSAR